MSNGIVLRCTECGNRGEFSLRAGGGFGVEAICEECNYIERWGDE